MMPRGPLPPIVVSAPRMRVVALRRGLGATTLPTTITSGNASTPAIPGSAASTAAAALPAPTTPAAALQQAQTDWINQVVTVIATGDSYLNAGETAQALTTYQAAGNAGATAVGPEIDLIGYPQISQPWTQKAWKLNGQLAATTSVADAQTYAKNMSIYYQAALQGVLDKINGTNIAALPSIGPTQVVMAAGMAAVIGAVISWWRPW
jgi:hypothetical protein